MRNIKELNDMELTIMLRELEEISNGNNITMGWVKVPEMTNDEIVSKKLELREGRITKPIFIINLKREIKNEMVTRFVAMMSKKQQDNIKIAV